MKHLTLPRLIILSVSLTACIHVQAQTEPPIPPNDLPAPPRIGLEDREELDENNPMIIVEEMPIFRNDPNGPHQYIASVLVYPQEAIEAGAQGTVYASFVVKIDGSVANVKILRGVHPALDAEVLRVLNAMPPDWKPGKQNGQNVNVPYNVPVRFKLDDETLFPSKKGKKKKKR